jgi:hypothetical protein
MNNLLKPKLDTATTQYVLDCREVEKMQGRELYDLINASITHDQLWIQHELPSFLIVTQQQFASLNGFTEEMYHVTDRMFKSIGADGKIQCIMEVVIDRDTGTNEEVEDAIQFKDEMVAEMKTGSPDGNKPEFPLDGIIPMS